MTVLVDTSVLIDWLRGDQRAETALRDVAGTDPLVAATPTRAELIAGVRPAERPMLDALLATLTWIDITAEVADDAGELALQFRRSHPGVDVVDYLIAAAARSVRARLLTTNVRHFPMFPGLEPAYR